MTLNELKNDVALLGFEDEIRDDALFISSANRAIKMIYTDRPLRSTGKVTAASPKIVLHRDLIIHSGGEATAFEVDGKALYFRSSGRGECVVETSNGSSLFPLSMNGQTSKAVISGGHATVTFRGDYYFTVTDFTVYGDIYARSTADIPEYRSLTTVYIPDYIKDFKSPAGLPRDLEGSVIDKAYISGNTLYLPGDYSGNVCIDYYLSAPALSLSEDDPDISISAETEHLLPLLTASFMWLDDDADKAQYYMSLYRDAIAGMRIYANGGSVGKYESNGWA